jgi:hypothetical protein
LWGRAGSGRNRLAAIVEHGKAEVALFDRVRGRCRAAFTEVDAAALIRQALLLAEADADVEEVGNLARGDRKAQVGPGGEVKLAAAGLGEVIS